MYQRPRFRRPLLSLVREKICGWKSSSGGIASGTSNLPGSRSSSFSAWLLLHIERAICSVLLSHSIRRNTKLSDGYTCGTSFSTMSSRSDESLKLTATTRQLRPYRREGGRDCRPDPDRRPRRSDSPATVRHTAWRGSRDPAVPAWSTIPAASPLRQCGKKLLCSRRRSPTDCCESPS